MKKIFKYSLRATYTTLRVPQGAEVEMTFRLVPAGSEFQLERSVFCGTVQLNNENLVLHVFRLL